MYIINYTLFIQKKRLTEKNPEANKGRPPLNLPLGQDDVMRDAKIK